MKTVVLMVFLAMLCGSPFALWRLATRYGSDWKFGKMAFGDKLLYLYLWVVIALWAGMIGYTVATN